MQRLTEHLSRLRQTSGALAEHLGTPDRAREAK